MEFRYFLVMQFFKEYLKKDMLKLLLSSAEQLMLNHFVSLKFIYYIE